MKRFILILTALLLVTSSALFAQPVIIPPKTSVFTRGVLTNTDAAGFRAAIGVGTNGATGLAAVDGQATNITTLGLTANATTAKPVRIANEGGDVFKFEGDVTTTGIGLPYNPANPDYLLGLASNEGQLELSMFSRSPIDEFTKTSEVEWITSVTNNRIIIDATSDLVVGYLIIYATNATKTVYSKVMLHVDAMTRTTVVGKVCQFQGAQHNIQYTVTMYHDSNGHIQVAMATDMSGGVTNADIKVVAFGPDMPTVGVYGDAEPDPSLIYAGTPFTTIDGNIAANSFITKLYQLLSTDGTVTRNTLSFPIEYDFHGSSINDNTTLVQTDVGEFEYLYAGTEMLVEGKFTATGTVDPPALLLDAVSRAETKARIKQEIPAAKQTGAVLFKNKATGRIEIYEPTDNKFYDLSYNVLPDPTDAEVAKSAKELHASSDKLKQSLSQRRLKSSKRIAKPAK